MYERYETREFEEKYTYFGNDLGATWTPRQTTFRLWAPTAREVTVNLYRSGTAHTGDLLYQLHMRPDVNGTWVAQHFGDLNGIYYTYLVMVDGQISEACDPYARATGVNGERAMVIDLDSTSPADWEKDRNPSAGRQITDAVIYELHIRDLSAHRSSRIQNKGKFLGLIETGVTTEKGQPVGLDHIKRLGITHLQLMPVFDFGYSDERRREPQFNWGYDPVNFNVPDGSYATDPYDGAVRIREMKQMIKALHENGISVVMDVVYNHVFDAKSFCFNKIVPGYFSRIRSDGVYSNGSCCGNDTATERAMVRKYIVDSVKYWADEYHMDGFRFDLAGLIDVQTIKEAMRTVHQRHPNVIFYGEGWRMDTALTRPNVELTVQENAALVPGFAFFNDTIRDLMRGPVFENTAPGYVTGAHCSKTALEACFLGLPSWPAGPDQSINYVSCHDNHTLFDRISLAAPDVPRETRVKMNNLAAAFTILSQGIPFIQAGEEMLRTKPGERGCFVGNSYHSPDSVNSLKWDDLDKAEYQQTVEYYRGLIAFRKAHPGLRLTSREAVKQCVHPVPIENSHTVAFRADDNTREIFAVFNADIQPVAVSLPDGRWDVNIRDGLAGTTVLAFASGSICVSPVSAAVLTREKAV